MRLRWCRQWWMLSVLAGAPSLAMAEDLFSKVDPSVLRSPVERLSPALPVSRFQATLGVGWVRPGSSEIQSIYGLRDTAYHGSVGMFGPAGFQVRLGASYLKRRGVAVGASSGEATESETVMKQVDLSGGLRWQPFRPRLLRVSPFIDLDVHYTLVDEQYDDTHLQLGRSGLGVGVGMLVRIDDPHPAWSVDARQGIQGTFLTVEASYSKVNSFGSSSLDLGGPSLTGGVSFEF